MSEQDFTHRMPSEARSARVIMFVQGGFVLLVYLLFLFLLPAQGLSGALTVLVLLNLAWGFIIVGVAFNFATRKRWVRIAAMVVEGIIVFLGVFTLLGGGNTIGGLINLLLAVLVIYLLIRPAARVWFGG